MSLWLATVIRVPAAFALSAVDRDDITECIHPVEYVNPVQLSQERPNHPEVLIQKEKPRGHP